MWNWLLWKLGKRQLAVRIDNDGSTTVVRLIVNNSTGRVHLGAGSPYFLAPQGKIQHEGYTRHGIVTSTTITWRPYTGIGSAKRVYWPTRPATRGDVLPLIQHDAVARTLDRFSPCEKREALRLLLDDESIDTTTREV